MLESIIKLVVGLLLCSVKFGVLFVPTIQVNGYNFLESILFGLASGLIGNVIFIYAGTFLNKGIDRFFDLLRGNKPRKIKKKFTKGMRRIVRIKSRYGLAGIALVSPIIISIPVGAFIAVRYYHNKKRILTYMMASVALWTLILSSINLLF